MKNKLLKCKNNIKEENCSVKNLEKSNAIDKQFKDKDFIDVISHLADK